MKALTETEIMEAVRKGRREGQDEMVCRYAERVFGSGTDARHLPPCFQPHRQLRPPAGFALHLALSHRLPPDTRLPETPSSDDRLDRRHPSLADGYQRRGAGGRTLYRTRTAHRAADGNCRHALPDDERMLLTLYYFEDRPLTEIAYITGIEASALANRLYRTRKKLFKKLTIDN